MAVFAPIRHILPPAKSGSGRLSWLAGALFVAGTVLALAGGGRVPYSLFTGAFLHAAGWFAAAGWLLQRAEAGRWPETGPHRALIVEFVCPALTIFGSVVLLRIAFTLLNLLRGYVLLNFYY